MMCLWVFFKGETIIQIKQFILFSPIVLVLPIRTGAGIGKWFVFDYFFKQKFLFKMKVIQLV